MSACPTLPDFLLARVAFAILTSPGPSLYDSEYRQTGTKVSRSQELW